MAIKPQYNVVPHGIRKTADDSYVAVFKMVITVEEFNRISDEGQQGIAISDQDWAEFTTIVDSARWDYLYSKGVNGNPGQLEFIKKQNESGGKKMFSKPKKIDTTKGQTVAFSNSASFGFGLHLPTSGDSANKMAFVDKSTQLIINKPPAEKISQLHNDLNNLESGKYKEMFRNAKDFVESKAMDENNFAAEYDFNMIYGTLLDEPYLAENYFGIVCEMTIAVSTLFGNAEDQKYTIITPESPKPGKAVYRFFKMNGKYYHGLEKMFFFKGPPQTGDFKDVALRYIDPYKSLQEGNAHPDGIYGIVTYHQDANGIIDPFVREGVKGCNIIVSNTGKFHSLSYHQVEYSFADDKDKPITVRTSGCMSPRSAIMTQSGGIRSNILFVWRGDNLLVNREETPDDMTNDHIMTGVKTDKCAENQFISESLFTKKESLLPGTQIQLRAQKNPYRFFVRTVGYTEHCLPLAMELSGTDEKEYLLTVEDFLIDTNHELFAFGPKEHFNVVPASVLPIRSVDIIGRKKYNDRNPGFVDNGNHIVVDNVSGEKSETRYIYPPSVKLEDIRYFGYLSKDKIKKSKEKELSLADYILRCKRMEDRNSNKLPQMALSTDKVDYLADPRGTYLTIYPADLFTRTCWDRFSKREWDDDYGCVKVFNFEQNYPYYSKTKSVALKTTLKKIPEKNYYGITHLLHLKLNNIPVFTALNPGIYRFNIYITDDLIKPEEIKNYNALPLMLSYVSKPPAPIMASQNEDFMLIPVSESETLVASRHNKPGDLPNLWFLQFDTSNVGRWKSLKYTEQTELLLLDQPNPHKLLKREQKRSSIKLQLLQDEYPYEAFLTTDGNIDTQHDLRAMIYPKTLLLHFDFPSYMDNLDDGQLLWSIDLTPTEKLTGRKTASGMRIYLDDNPLEHDDFFPQIWIRYESQVNAYSLYNERYAGKRHAILKNYINPEISLRDIIIPDDMLNLYMGGEKYSAHLAVMNEYIVINNRSHPYASHKKIRLFASSLFQGYFPKLKNEFEIGTTGSAHLIFIPNNILPEQPKAETDVLIMHFTDECWDDDRKSNEIRSLVKISLSQDFMKEGKCNLGIVVQNLTDNKQDRVSLAADDITKLSGRDFSAKKLTDFLDLSGANNLFSKYISSEPFKKFLIEGKQYLVLQCIPFYDYKAKKWQVVLPLSELDGAESMFIKMSILKIAPGHKFEPWIANNEVAEDVSGTNLSKITLVDPFPVYNRKVFEVLKEKNSFHIKYKGTTTAKLFFLMLVNCNYVHTEMLAKGPLAEDLLDISCKAAIVGEGVSTKNILCFCDGNITIERTKGKVILLMEFEVHTNYRGNIPKQPTYFGKNPLFETEGIRLLNVSEFRY